MPKFGELNMLDFSSVALNCFVEVDDFDVRIGKGSEKLKHVFGILLQFMGMMGESTEDSGRCGIPGDGPITMGLDNFGGFATANGEVKIPDRSSELVIGEGGEETGENGVKVDRRSR